MACVSQRRNLSLTFRRRLPSLEGHITSSRAASRSTLETPTAGSSAEPLLDVRIPRAIIHHQCSVETSREQEWKLSSRITPRPDRGSQAPGRWGAHRASGLGRYTTGCDWRSPAAAHVRRHGEPSAIVRSVQISSSRPSASSDQKGTYLGVPSITHIPPNSFFR